MDSTEEPPAKRSKSSQETESEPSLSQINQVITTLSSNQEKLLSDNAALLQKVDSLTKEVTELHSSLSSAHQLLTSIHQGQQRLLTKTRHGMPLPTAMNATNATEEEEATTTTTLPSLPGIDEKTPHKLTPTNEKLSDNNLYLIDVLLALRSTGCINVEFISKSPYPKDLVRCSGNTCYIRYCLELVEYVASHNEGLSECIKSLADTSIANSEVIHNVADILVNACSEKIEELDGKKVRKKTVIGLGSRVRDYKKKMAKGRLGGGEEWNGELVEREEVEEGVKEEEGENERGDEKTEEVQEKV